MEGTGSMGWMRWGALGLLVWLVVSVPVGILAGRVIKAGQGPPEKTGPQGLPVIQVSPSRESPDPRGSQAFLASLVSQGPRAVRDRPVIRFKDRPVPPESQSKDRLDPPVP